MTQEEFISECKKKHKNKYDYSLVKFSSFRNKVKIKCPIHGMFEQKAYNHFHGVGCKHCGRMLLAEKLVTKWSDQECQFLIANYPNKSVRECSKILNKCYSIVGKQIHKLGLKRQPFARGYKDISGPFWLTVIHGAKLRNLEFIINIEDVWQLYIRQDKKCALTGESIEFDPKNKFTTASIDRIDSNKGYTLDNIQIVHKKINRLKMANKDNEFYEMCKSVYNYSREKFERKGVIEHWDEFNEWVTLSGTNKVQFIVDEELF